MKHVKLFEQFINEAVTVEQRDKVFNDAKKWADALNLDYKIDVGSYGGGGWVMVYTGMGSWTLDLEAATKSAGQDSMYRASYTQDRNNLKWYIKFPGRSNTYNYRSNTKPGNLKTFKSLVERFEAVRQNFELAEKFLALVGIDRKLKDSINFQGKNLKELGVSYRINGDGDLDYNLDKYGTKDYRYQCRFKKLEGNGFDREDFDPTKGELFYYAALAGRKDMENVDLILGILELLKDKPVDEVWKLIEKGDWKDLAHQFRGKLTSKKFGI